jgi:hypothetical protein
MTGAPGNSPSPPHHGKIRLHEQFTSLYILNCLYFVYILFISIALGHGRLQVRSGWSRGTTLGTVVRFFNYMQGVKESVEKRVVGWLVRSHS